MTDTRAAARRNLTGASFACGRVEEFKIIPRPSKRPPPSTSATACSASRAATSRNRNDTSPGTWAGARSTPACRANETSASPVCYADEVELQTELFEGACEGRIGLAPRGQGGFGYDPLFVPEGHEATFAELGEEVKNQMSHRAKALAKLKERLQALPEQSPGA